MSCSVLLKSVLLIACVFWIFFSERWQSTLYQIFFLFFFRKYRDTERRQRYKEKTYRDTRRRHTLYSDTKTHITKRRHTEKQTGRWKKISRAVAVAVPAEDVKLKDRDVVIAGEVDGGLQSHGLQRRANRVSLMQRIAELLPRHNDPAKHIHSISRQAN